MRQQRTTAPDGPNRVAGRRALRLVGPQRAPRLPALDTLAASQSLLAATLESTTDGILVVDLQGTVVGRNSAFDDLWHTPPHLAGTDDDGALLHHAMSQLVDPEQFLARVGELYARPTVSTQDELLLLDGRVLERYSAPQRTADRVVGRVWRFRDVTAERRLRADLERQAYTDPLTGLANRTRFMHDLQAALDGAGPAGPAVCLLDLDGFKFVNDALGHRAGDRVLQSVAERLTALVPADATVARLGGDEFGIVLPHDHADDADALCARAVERLSLPVAVLGGPARVGASAGWSRQCPDDGSGRRAAAAPGRPGDVPREEHRPGTRRRVHRRPAPRRPARPA